jgi:bifunctional DNA-binding transcriptional regulator/antitoxin component of YhaV-PrlF toxin-antitoxin module
MVWNPTDRLEDALTPLIGTDVNVPIWGGKHFIYVWETKYDEGDEAYNVLTNNFNLPVNASQTIPTDVADLYKQIMYVGNPIMAEGKSLKVDAAGQVVIPSEVQITINMERPFESFATSETIGSGSNNTLPRYRFSTVGLAPQENVEELAKSALDNIRVVPNPYYAYSAYEESQIDNVVKITNLPNRCTISIFSLDGKLVRKYDRAVGTNIGESTEARQELSSGNIVGQGVNLDNSLNWDLNNQQRIPVGSGTYIIHVDAPGIGQKTVKSVVFLRPTDVSNF